VHREYSTGQAIDVPRERTRLPKSALHILQGAVPSANVLGYKAYTSSKEGIRFIVYAFNAEHFIKGTDINQIFDELGVDERTHAFYLGKELMKAAIARGLGKNYRQESPLDWGYLTFDEPRRERVRLTARSRSTEEAS